MGYWELAYDRCENIARIIKESGSLVDRINSSFRVHYGKKTAPSGKLLADELRGVIEICWGYGDEGLNAERPANKREALETMRDNGVSVPKLIDDPDQAIADGRTIVGRPDNHTKGRGFWLCDTHGDIKRALRGTKKKQPATHFMEFIEAEREFRVHIVDGRCIKLSEKVGGEGLIKTFGNGWTFEYPKDFNHKKTLRSVAKQAVEVLGLDFGAVDILWADGAYVLEVNTAPCLTSGSDTLQRYVDAFRSLV